MEEVAILAIGAIGITLYNTFSEPAPSKEHDKGTALPVPRQLYSDPAQWTGSPVDLTYRQSESFFGPGNEPRRRYILPGGTRVVHHGWSPAWTKTNQAWMGGSGSSAQPSGGTPTYQQQPSTGIGEKKVVTSRTMFIE